MKCPLNSRVVKLHSNYTSLFFVSVWVIITSNYFTTDNILCVSRFDGSVASPDFEDFCLTYSYKESSKNDFRYYALHYKWLHWMLLCLALIYKVPGLLSCLYSSDILTVHLKDLSSLQMDYTLESRAVNISISYWKRNYGGHRNFRRNVWLVHLFCLLINGFCFLVLDHFLQGNYYAGLVLHWPFSRDYHKFSDPLSLVFPPFTECEITPMMQLWTGRTERLGCHLSLMELYEKLLLAVWLWQVLLTVITLLYLTFWLPWFTANSQLCCGGQEKTPLLQKFKHVQPDELLALSMFKKYLTSAQMRYLLFVISEEYFHIQ